MESGLQFVNSLLLFTGSVFIATGLALWIFETGPEEGLKTRAAGSAKKRSRRAV